MIIILSRCVVIYALLIFVMRFTGKRQIGELEISELITTLLISEVAVHPITETDYPLWQSCVTIIFLSAIEVLITFVTSKSPRLRSIIAGGPSVVIKDGKINQKELKKIRMSAAELMAQLRIKEISSPTDVRYAYFEEDGQLSVFKYSDDPITYAVISDGHINRFNMRESGFTLKMIRDQLKGKAIDSVLLMLVTSEGEVDIIYKE